ncbi:TPA: DUF371 domain-containing protein [Candidatus Woesearchaeota archaeon]|nr:DUF371 domain-containing protein [Candidatus Woesearchaeota archaeon]
MGSSSSIPVKWARAMGKGAKAATEYTFTARGHPNILATHPTTLMFTRDTECTTRGDCIVGVSADFELVKIKRFLKEKSGRGETACTLTMSCPSGEETISGMLNSLFDDPGEIVFRVTSYLSKRTLFINCTKSSSGLSRRFAEGLRDPKQRIRIRMS